MLKSEQFSVICCPTHTAWTRHSDTGSLAALQALLSSLLAPGTPVPDGAGARITLGGTQVEARWQQAQGTWAVVSSGPAASPPCDLNLSLLYADRPVVRLPSISGEQPAANDVSLHRISLMIQADACSGCFTIIGSAGHEAAPSKAGNAATEHVLQCVARGCWGTCLPVTVAAVDWESESGGETTDTAPPDDDGTSVPCSSLLALTVSAWPHHPEQMSSLGGTATVDRQRSAYLIIQ
jgi:hypothetical protein